MIHLHKIEEIGAELAQALGISSVFVPSQGLINFNENSLDAPILNEKCRQINIIIKERQELDECFLFGEAEVVLGDLVHRIFEFNYHDFIAGTYFENAVEEGEDTGTGMITDPSDLDLGGGGIG